jgi:hypothetical protein
MLLKRENPLLNPREPVCKPVPSFQFGFDRQSCSRVIPVIAVLLDVSTIYRPRFMTAVLIMQIIFSAVFESLVRWQL